MKTPLKQLLYLSDDDIRRALPMPAAIAVMREAFAELSSGRIVLPLRQHLEGMESEGVALSMSCYSPSLRLFSLKNVTVFQQNRRLGLPSIQATLLLTDGTTGTPLAVMEAGILTSLRTGAASGLATDLLARPNVETAGIIGTGVQARTQLEAMCCVRSIRRALVYGRRNHAARQFAKEAERGLGIAVEPVDTAAEVIRQAGVICTATNSAVPVFEDRDLPTGVHLNAVGTYRPDMTEIPAATVRRARLVVDHRASALQEAGDLLMPLRQGLLSESQFGVELGEVVGNRNLQRRSDDEITLFKSVGVAVQDLYAAARALENARRLGLGVPLNAQDAAIQTIAQTRSSGEP